MQKYNLRDFAEFIGILSIVAGLVLVAYELRQNSQLMQAQVFNDRSDQGIEVFLTMAENRDLSEIDAKLSDAGFPDNPEAYSQLTAVQKRQYSWFLRADRFRLENVLYQQLIGVMEYDEGHIAGANRLLRRYDAISANGESPITGRNSTQRLKQLVVQVEEMYGGEN